MKTLLSLWLIPQEDDEKYLQDTISYFNNKFNTSPFIPHITIYGAIEADLKIAEDAAKYSIEKIKAFSVNFQKLDHSKEWSKTLFMQMALNDNLILIFNRLKEKLIMFGDYNLNPHISLIYKEDMTDEQKIEEINKLSLKKEYIFNRIAIATPLNKIEKWHDVSRWDIPFIKNL